MSVLIPGTDTFPANITAPAILDPANGAEIATMGTHLAQRTFYLAKFHLHRYVAVALDDVGYPPEDTIIVTGSFQTVGAPAMTLSFTPGDVLAGDLIEISSSFNYETVGVGLLEIAHLADVDGLIVGRRRMPLGLGLSFTHTSFHTIVAGGHVDFDMQVKIDAGSVAIQRPLSLFARLMRETT